MNVSVFSQFPGFRQVSVGLATAWLGVLLCSCGAGTGGGKGSDTNWLSHCTSDQQCSGDASCLCGICTKACDGDRECSEVADDARCTSLDDTGSCDGTVATVCAVEAAANDSSDSEPEPNPADAELEPVPVDGSVDNPQPTDDEPEAGPSNPDDGGASNGGAASGAGGSTAEGDTDPTPNEDGCPDGATWSAMISDGEPTPTQERSTFWTGKEVLVLSFDNQAPLDAGRYDPCADRWSPVNIEDMPQVVYYSSSGGQPPIVTEERLFFLYPGIWTNPSPLESTSSAIVYDIEEQVWTELPLEGAPAPAASAAVTLVGNAIFVWGGMTEEPAGSLGVLTNEGGLLDMETLTWTRVNPEGAPSPRAAMSVAVVGNQVAVWGGALDTTALSGCFDECNVAGDGALYDPASNTWQPLAAAGAPTARERATAYGTYDRFVVWGGQALGAFRDGGVYSTASGAWTPIDVALDSFGYPESGAVFPELQPPYLLFAGPTDTGVYDPRTNLVVSFDSTNRPPDLGGRRVGGVTMAEPLNGTDGTLWRANAAATRWEAAVLPDQAHPLLNGSVVWTGTRFIAWGGYTEMSDPNSPSGCENLPPEVTGCDPIQRTIRTYEPGGAHLVPDWN